MKNIYQVVKRSFILISVFLVFYAIILVSSQIVLESYLDELSQQNKIANSKTDITVSTVDEINKKLGEVSNMQRNEINWLNLLELISNNTSNDIKYSRISMDKTGGLVLAGQSKTRDGLIKIKKFLDEAPFLSDIDFPISNLLEKDDINFNITAKIKNYEFK